MNQLKCKIRFHATFEFSSSIQTKMLDEMLDAFAPAFTVLWLDSQKQPPVLHNKTILKNFATSTGNTMNIAKYLILPILKNICKQLLFNFFNGSLLHGPKGLRSRLYDDVRLLGPCYKSTFCFISQHLSPSSKSQPAFENLRLINTFDKTIKFLHWLFLVALVSGCFRWF